MAEINYVYICSVNASYYDDKIPNTVAVYKDAVRAEDWRARFEATMAEHKNLALPDLGKCHTDEQLDRYNSIKLAQTFISCDVKCYPLR